MVIAPDGQLPLPWLAAPLAALTRPWRGHALLLRATPGDGALALGFALAQALLCEAPRGDGRPCGTCASCRLIQAGLHPDRLLLLPEALRRELGLPLDNSDSDDPKRKPSRQIRVDEVRTLIDWAQKSASGARGKLALVFPAEAMNETAASALLKTLEEPPPGVRLLLLAADPARLLPTVRSRCQLVRLPAVSADAAQAWLAAQGVVEPAVLLSAAGGRPLDALALQRAGVDAARWSALPRALRQGDAAVLAGWSVPQAVDALQKLCHDALARAQGAPPRYFPLAAVPADASPAALAAWAKDLQGLARHADHPWHEPLLTERLAHGARAALAGRSHGAAGPAATQARRAPSSLR